MSKFFDVNDIILVSLLLRYSNGIRTHSHLVRKRTLNHFAKLAIFYTFF